MFVRNAFRRLLPLSARIALPALLALGDSLDAGPWGSPSGPAEAQSGDLYLTKTSVTVEEGYMEEFGVRPASQPANLVTVRIEIIEQVDAVFAVYVMDSYGNTLRCGKGSVCQLGFDPVNWNRVKYVGVGALPDDDNQNGSGKVKITTQSNDSNFNGIEKTLDTNEDDQVGAPVPAEKAIVVSAGADIHVNEGGSASYTVKLSQAPGADVTVAVSASGDGSITVSPASLTFTADNYSTAQSVTLTAAEDDDGLAGTATIAHAARDGGYNGVSKNLTATEVENDKVEFVVSPAPGPLSLTEGGISHTYTVKLGSQPTADVAVAITETPDDDGITVSPASLTFTTSTWNTAQTVTIAAVEDNDYTIDTATVSHSVITSDTSGYGSLTIGDIAVTAKDNDAAIFIDTDPDTSGNQTGLVLVENGSSARYTVKLSNEPAANVTVSISETQNPSTGNVRVTSSKSLTFTTSNWDTAQTVTVRAQSDQDAINGTPTINHTASGGEFGGVTASVAVTEIDSQMGISTKRNNSNVNAVTVVEEATATYGVSLGAKPATNVTVTIAAADTGSYTDSDITVSPASLTFTPQNYDTAQTVTLSATADIDMADGRRTITHTTTYADRTFTKDITAREDDNDTGGLMFDKNTVAVNENGTGTYRVKLTHKPNGSVSVRVSAAAGDTDITVRDTNDSANGNQTGSIPFNANNWDVYRTVTLAAANDADGTAGSRTINHTANGGGYSNVTGSVTANEVDDDHGIILNPSPADGITVTEGSTATYTVKLATAPTANVTVTIAESATAPNNDTNITVTSPANKTLTFTPQNYGTTQTVTLSAAHDSDRFDGSRDINHASTSSDSSYSNLSASLTATEDDDDSAHGRDTLREFTVTSDSEGIWSDGTTIWVSDGRDDKLYAYTLTTGAADTNKNIDLSNNNGNARGIWSDGTTIWVADSTDRKVYAHTLATGARVTAKEFNLSGGNRNARGIWSDGTTLWVSDYNGRRVWAYNLATGVSDTTRAFDLHSANRNPTGIWSDGTTMWVADDSDGKLYAYTLVGGARDTTKEFDLNSGNSLPSGVWSNGTTMWVSDNGGSKLYAYHAPVMTQRLTADDATASTIRLTIAWHPENWYYKHTTPSGGQCSGAVGTASTRVAGLALNRAHTFAAYSDSACSTLLATANTLETRGSHLALSNFTKTTNTYDVTLTLANWDTGKDGNWSYKTNLSGARGACVAATANPATVDDFGFSANENHVFSAYRGSACTGTAIASSPSFSPSVGIPALTAGSITLSGATLTLSKYSGTWWQNSNYGTTGCTQVGSGTTTSALAKLTPGTSYTYHAFSASGCAETKQIDSVTFTTGAVGDRITDKDFSLHSNHYDARQIWSDGTTLWVNNYNSTQLYAYTLATGQRDTTKEFTLNSANNWPSGIWSDGTTLWVAENHSSDRKLYAYTLATGARVTSKEFNLAAANALPQGIWSDGTTMWVGDADDKKLYAYTLATGARDTAKEFDLHSNNDYPADYWSDGTTMWVAENDSNITTDRKLYAYTLATGARDTDKEFDLVGDSTVEPNGIWSDGTVMWVVDASASKVYAYYMYPRIPELTAGSVTLSNATLKLSNFTAAWWHNSDYGAAGCTRVSAGTDTATLEDLTLDTPYTYHAFSASGCKQTDKISSVSFTTAAPGDRIANKDFNLQDSNYNGAGSPRGIWSDGTTLYVVDNNSTQLYAYTLATGERDTAKEFNLHSTNDFPTGLWSDGTTIWVAEESTPAKLFAYTLATGARDTAKDINLYSGWNNPNNHSQGIWSNGVTMWVGDVNTKRVGNTNTYKYKVYAYTLATGARDESKEFYLDDNNNYGKDYWSDGTTMWVADSQDRKLYAYELETGKRDTSKEFDLEGDYDVAPYGIWSDGTVMWVADNDYQKMYAYHIYPPTKRLRASGIGKSGATLNITWHTDDWWYKRIAPTGDSSCRRVPAGTITATLSGLQYGTEYTYKAYEKSDCSADEIDSVTFSTTTLTADDASPTTMRLTITHHTGDWYYKYTSPSGGQCSAKVTGATVRVTGLEVNEEYTFTAYTNSACSTLLSRAIPASTLQPSLAAVAGSEAGTVTLTLSDWTVTDFLLVAPWITDRVDGPWYVKYTTPSGGVCSTPQKHVNVATVTALAGGVAHTFAAYSDSACSKLVATAAPVTPASSGTGGAGGAGGAFGPRFPGQQQQTPQQPDDPAIVPDAPASVSASRSNGNIAVSWSAADGATGYDVRYSTDDKATWQQAATNLAGTSYTLSNADSTKTYVIGVRAVNDAGESGWTNSAAVSPPEPEPQPPATVASVSAVHNGGSLSASWSAADGATGYDVEYSTDDKATWQRAATNHAGTSYTLSDADSAKTYVISVRAVNDAGESAWTNSAPVSPPEPETQPPGGVASVSAVHNGGSLSVSWSAAAGATGYDVVYSTDDKASWERAASNHAETSYTLDGADAGKAYVVGVRAVNSAGESWWTDSEPATPAAPGAVASVSVAHNGRSLSVSWTAAERAASYHVTYSDDDGQSWQLADGARQGTSLTIKDADAGKTYIVGIRAQNAGGFSGWTDSPPAAPP